MEILIVNPQPIWAQRIQARLRSTGARVSIANDWNSAVAVLDEAWPDIIIIEHRVLEKETGTLLATLRQGEWLPIIVPTALAHLSVDSAQVSLRGEEALRRLEMLVMRLQGAFEPAQHQRIRVGKLTIDPARKEVVFAAKRIPLPPNQFRLLLYLALNADRVVNQRELAREVWGHVGPESEVRELIKTYVRSIRNKLGWTDESNNYLQSVRGFGYMLTTPPRMKKTPDQGAERPAKTNSAGKSEQQNSSR
ncbi:MAG: winged helix-turn-helix transcriptional regulator [Anaerolineae bacterium]